MTGLLMHQDLIDQNEPNTFAFSCNDVDRCSSILRGLHRAAGVTGAGSGIICIGVCVETYGMKP